LPSWFERAIEKQVAWAAASSSSGLVRPLWASVRDDQVTGRREYAPLETYRSIPDPEVRSPLQVASAWRTSDIVSSSHSRP
jgi:hypothetical protein